MDADAVTAEVAQQLDRIRDMSPGPERGQKLIEFLLGCRWYAQPDDLIGGACIMPIDLPPSSGHPSVGDFLSDEIARHIVELHNAALD